MALERDSVALTFNIVSASYLLAILFSSILAPDWMLSTGSGHEVPAIIPYFIGIFFLVNVYLSIRPGIQASVFKQRLIAVAMIAAASMLYWPMASFPTLTQFLPNPSPLLAPTIVAMVFGIPPIRRSRSFWFVLLIAIASMYHSQHGDIEDGLPMLSRMISDVSPYILACAALAYGIRFAWLNLEDSKARPGVCLLMSAMFAALLALTVTSIIYEIGGNLIPSFVAMAVNLSVLSVAAIIGWVLK